MSNQTLVSQENILSILAQVVNDLKVKITNKDISLPYTTQLNKLSTLKIDGNGSMYLSNNGNYISLGSLSKSNLDINEINKIFNITTVADHWNSTGILPIPTAKYGLTSQIYNGKIYCIGGIVNGANSINTVSIYDIVSNTWTTGTTMPTSRYCLTSQLYNGKIYCIGGCISGNTYSNILEIYDIASNSWTTGTNMTTTRYDLTSQLYNGKIYCIGGYNFSSAYLNKVEIYDIISNTWTTGTNIPIYVQGLTSQIYNGKIYCIGGTNGTVFNKVEIYDIASNSWTTGTNMTTARYGLTSQIYNGKIYCIGGCISGGNNSNIVEIYDIVNNIWNTSVAMSSARYYLTSQIYNGKMYCIGGTNGGYLNIVETLWLFCNVYTITLPSIIQTKLNKILTSGTGVNIFRNDGTYKPIVPVYNVMDSATINTFLSGL